MEVERLLFLFVNFLIAFLIPLVAITVSYTFIFAAIFRSPLLPLPSLPALTLADLKAHVHSSGCQSAGARDAAQSNSPCPPMSTSALRLSWCEMRVTNMMLTVIVLFAASWLPLYCLFTYIYFGSPPTPPSPVPKGEGGRWGQGGPTSAAPLARSWGTSSAPSSSGSASPTPASTPSYTPTSPTSFAAHSRYPLFNH